MPFDESRKCDGIFGTPVEPLFNNEENGTNSEILQDWLINMAVMNSETLKSEDISEVRKNLTFKLAFFFFLLGDGEER